MRHLLVNYACPPCPHLVPIYPILITTISLHIISLPFSNPLRDKVGTGRDIRDVYRFTCPKEGDNCPITYPTATLETDIMCPQIRQCSP